MNIFTFGRKGGAGEDTMIGSDPDHAMVGTCQSQGSLL